MSHATIKAVQPVDNQYTDCTIQGPFANLISHIIAGIFDNMQHIYEGWNFNSGNYLFTTDTK